MPRSTLPRLVAVTLISLPVLLVAVPALASPGDLDTSFSTDGIATTAVNDSSDAEAGVAVAANGDILAAGTQENSAATASGFVVVEYTPAGKLDHSFGGGDGIATATLGSCTVAQGMAVDSQGRIVVAGYRYDCTSGSTVIAVARFEPDGTLDPSFGGGDGKRVISLAGTGENATAVAMDGDRIVLAGSVEPKNRTVFDFLLIRLNDDGTADHSFSQDGLAFVSVDSGGSTAQAVAVQSNHRVVACGSTTNGPGGERFAVARLLSTGGLDTSFSSDGKATVNFSPTDDFCTAVVLDGGSIVLGGLADFSGAADCALARLTSSGHLDGTFGTNGRTTQSLSSGVDNVTGLAIGGSGKIVASAIKDGLGNDRFGVLRYRDDGTLDPSFGTGGIVTTKINSHADPGAVATGGGSIVVSGSTVVQSGNFEIAVARYHS
jgi:uncharacterized delta-60 repeat protein